MIENRGMGSQIRVILTYIVIVMMGILCFVPLWNMVCLSFSGTAAVMGNRVTVYPIDFQLESYKELLVDSQFWRSFWISLKRVVLGWSINMVLVVSAAYPLSKTEREFRGRNIYMGLFLFAMLFSGGMIPTYLLVKNLGLLNSVWSLVLVGAVPIFNLIMVKNFFVGIPSSLEEAARMDGATPLQILVRVYIPCSKPVLATVSLFSIVGHWNDYFKGLIYMTKIRQYPLMTYIQKISVNMQELVDSGASMEELEAAAAINSRSLDAAKIVVATIPLLLIYPIMQKYLITGITIGAVKE